MKLEGIIMLKKLVLLALIAPVLANASWLEERRCSNIYEAGFATGLYSGQCGVSIEATQQKYEPRLMQVLNKYNCAQYNEKNIAKLKQNTETLKAKYLKKASAPNFCANFDAEIDKLLRKYE